MKLKYSLITACLFASTSYADEAPKNIIYMIGDGMGPAFTTAYRYYHDDPSTEEIEPTVFDSNFSRYGENLSRRCYLCH